MLEQLRLLGIQLGMNGTRLLERMMSKEIKAADMTDQQIQLVLEAWDTRNYVPIDKLEYVDRVKPLMDESSIKNEEDQRRYNREYVETIEKYLKTLPFNL